MSIHKMTQKELGEQLKELAADQVAEVKIKLTRGDVWTRLADRQGNPLPDASYKLYQGGELIDEGTTNSLGEFKVEDLVQGLYKVELVTTEGHQVSSEVPWLKKGQGPHQQVLRLPMITELSWGKKEIFPLFYPRQRDDLPEEGATSVPLVIRTLHIPDGVPGSQLEIKLYGFDEDGARHELPLTLLGIEFPDDIEVRGGQVVSAALGDRPALELRLPWTEEGGVYPVELDWFMVEVWLAGPSKRVVPSPELKRTRPVTIFSNPTGDLQYATTAASNFKLKADEVGRLILFEYGNSEYTGHKPRSIFEEDVERFCLPMEVATKHMRGSTHTFYVGHGDLAVDGDAKPCDSCRFRAAWKAMAQDKQVEYLASVLKPLKIDAATNAYVRCTWEELRGYVSRREDLTVWYDLDESGGAPSFTPEATSGWAGSPFCMESPDSDMVDLAAQRQLGGYSVRDVGNNNPTGPSSVRHGYRQHPPNLHDTGRGERLTSPSEAHIPSVESRCKTGEASQGKRMGYIFWETDKGQTLKAGEGNSFMRFSFKDSSEYLDAEVVKGLPGEHPTPSELMYAGGCLTASSPDLAESFLAKGTRVFIGNQKVVYAKWMDDFAQDFAYQLFPRGKSTEEAFKFLKGEYLTKLHCKMFVKGRGPQQGGDNQKGP